MWIWLALACTGQPGSTDTESSGASDTPSQTDASDTDGGEDTEGREPNAIALTGEVIWTLTFDEEAQDAGYSDCSYARSITAEEVLDEEYLCPDCTHIVAGVGVLDSLDCVGQISSVDELVNPEVWGLSETAFHRTTRLQYPPGELAVLDGLAEGEDIALSWTSESSLSEGGTMTLVAEGSFSYETTVVAPEPWPERTEDYACGWPRQPIEAERTYPLAEGEVVPNVVLTDQCGEDVQLWDLAGRWIVLDSTQSDCGPCRNMAEESEAFVASMAEQGFEVMVVSLLGNGLSDPYGTPDEETQQAWVEAYTLNDPVLADRGYAYALFPEYLESIDEGFGYPAWLLLDPELRLVTGNVGFGSWDTVEILIEEAAAKE